MNREETTFQAVERRQFPETDPLCRHLKEFWATSILSDAQELIGMGMTREANDKINSAKKVLCGHYKELEDGFIIEVDESGKRKSEPQVYPSRKRTRQQTRSHKARRAIKLFRTEMSDSQIARSTSLSTERVRQLRKLEGLPPSTHQGRTCSTMTEETLGTLLRELQGTKTLHAIQKELHMGRRPLQRICKRYNISTEGRKTTRRTYQHHSLKVPQDEFLAYFREHLHEPNMRVAMTKRYPLSKAYVYHRIERLHKRGYITDQEIETMDNVSGNRCKRKPQQTTGK